MGMAKEANAKEGEVATTTATSTTTEVKDISHLVKRKRKIEEADSNEAQPAKKPTP